MKITIQDYTWQIILNPYAMSHKSGSYWNQVETILTKHTIKYQYHITDTISDAQNLISSLCIQGERYFMVIGGDGTFNTFINEVMNSGINPTEVFMVPIILGTGNDWARTHFLKNTFHYSHSFIQLGSFTSHDIGLVEVFQDDHFIDKRYFLNIAGFGFDAEVIKNSMNRKPRFFPGTVYLFGLLSTLLHQKTIKTTIETSNNKITTDIFSIAVGIGQFNGNGMKQCPNAIPNDHLFELVLIEKVAKLKVIKNVKNLYNGSHIEKLKEISNYRTDSVMIKSKPYIRGEVEGELLPLGDYKISNMQQSINILSELWN